MKNLQTAVLCLCFLGITAATAFGQDNINVKVSATVQANIELTNPQDVSFGNIQATSNPVINPNGSNQDVTENAQFGKVTVSASNSTQLVISWDQTIVSLGDGSGNTISFTTDISGNETDDAASSTDLTDNAGTSNSNTVTSSSGDYFIYVGGEIGPLTNQTTGTYTSTNGSGDLTVTVRYQ